MSSFLYIFFGLIGLVTIVSVIWRLASRHHSHPCPVWLHWLVELDNPFTKTNRAEVILQHLELKPGMIVLDVGCGPGRLTIPAARQVGQQGEVVAMDIQAGMLELAGQKALTAKLTNIMFLHAGVGEGKLAKN